MSPEELKSIENPDPRRAENEEEGGTGDAADNFLVDGRIVGGPHADRDESEPIESPEHDAEVQGASHGGMKRLKSKTYFLSTRPTPSPHPKATTKTCPTSHSWATSPCRASARE